MPTIALPLTGACRCGRVKIRATKPAFMTAACHCTGCQKMASSAFSLTAMFPADGFEVTEGETVIGGMHGDFLHHNFCAHCMSWMFTRLEGRDFVNVRPTMFDDNGWFRPFIETCTDEGLGFGAIGAVHSFGMFPPAEAFPAMLGEFAAWSARE
ncbi:MAG TPA: GFA family protein [Mesorhizobium sp.]